jgi:hypothetical protein
LDKKIENVKKAYKAYETSLDETQDLEEKHLQKLLDIQNEYYELLNQELEVKLSIDKDDLEYIEFKLKQMSDDFYQMAEAAALVAGSQLTSYKNQGQTTEEYVD